MLNKISKFRAFPKLFSRFCSSIGTSFALKICLYRSLKNELFSPALYHELYNLQGMMTLSSIPADKNLFSLSLVKRASVFLGETPQF